MGRSVCCMHSDHGWYEMHVLCPLLPCGSFPRRPCYKDVLCRDATSEAGPSPGGSNGAGAAQSRSSRAVPSDHDIGHVLRQVQLGPLLDRVSGDGGAGLNTTADWASMLSLGEQQRLAFARYVMPLHAVHL